MSPIERSALSFESFLDREFAQRFYSEAFLTGLCDRRLEIYAAMSKAANAAFFAATILAFFDLIAGKEFSYSGLTLQISKDLSPIIALFAASAFLRSTFLFIDEMIIVNILIRLGARINIHNFPLLLVDKAVINLWGDALTPRAFGPKSGFGHTAAFWTLTCTSLLALAGLALFIPGMVVWTTYQTFLDPDARLVALCLGALACIVSLWGIALVTISFWKFKFLPADWIESTDTPTDDFARKMGWALAPDDEGRNAN